MTLSNRMSQKRGSTLLLCTLATAVISTASIAILRSSQRQIARLDAQTSTTRGRTISDGLTQRAIAILRVDPNANGVISDPDLDNPDARCQLTRLSGNATQIQVFLYRSSTTPAADVIVDPAAL